jgi:hypothetical protein
LPAGRLARLGATPDFHHGLLAAARRPPSNEDSLADESSLGGLKRSFVTQVAEKAGTLNGITSTGSAIPRPTQFAIKPLF